MKIAIDFDGTCVTHEYPRVGREIGAEEVLRELVEEGHQLILFTMRHGQGLQDAVDWCADNMIKLHGVQSDPDQKRWTDSPKAYAQLYIDDAALGCPLLDNGVERPFVDWVEVRNELVRRRVL